LNNTRTCVKARRFENALSVTVSGLVRLGDGSASAALSQTENEIYATGYRPYNQFVVRV
jgi:hypothetical protein